MKNLAALVFLSLAIAGCDRAAPYGSAGKMALEATVSQDVGSPAPQTLAYQHKVWLTAPAGHVADVFQAVQAKCAELTPARCQLLDSRLTTDRRPSASLKLRAPHDAIEQIVGVLPNLGEVSSRATTVEDLAVAIADSKKQLAIKTDYRARLEALLPRASNDVVSLVKINQELAQVQAEIEAAAGREAYLANRVNTELLEVQIEAPNSRGVRAWLANAPSDIAEHLADGTSAAIATSAFLVPWAVLLTILVALWRAWRRARRRRAAA